MLNVLELCLKIMLYNRKFIHLQCVFHSIRFKVNKGWTTAVVLFLCLYASTDMAGVHVRSTCHPEVISHFILFDISLVSWPESSNQISNPEC